MLLVEGGTRVTQLAEGLRTVPREENRRFAQTIADVVELATLRVNEELAISGDLDKAARIPVIEVSLLLNVSRTMAGVYIDNGLQLRDRFHQTRAAFEAGDIGFTHVREIVTALQGVDDELLARVEPEAILIAQQGLSRSVLRNELDRMVIAVDQTERQNYAKRWNRTATTDPPATSMDSPTSPRPSPQPKPPNSTHKSPQSPAPYAPAMAANPTNNAPTRRLVEAFAHTTTCLQQQQTAHPRPAD